MDRYHRQVLLPQIGTVGQERLGRSSVLIIGSGALGSTIAEQLARSGVGKIRIADRDIVELTNLQRQVLFDENDVREHLPKAIAGAQRLRSVNSSVAVDPRVVDVDQDNIEELCAGMNLILDGTDNVATRYLINDVSIKLNIPWVYGGCVGTEGRVMMIEPGDGPCLRCLFPNPPDGRELPTCDTAGVLGPVATVIGGLQAIAAIKVLSGNGQALHRKLLSMDLWTNHFQATDVSDARLTDCPACSIRKFEFLDSHRRDMTARLCGRNAVQVRAASAGFTLKAAAKRLEPVGEVQETPFMVRCVLDDGGLTLVAFADGRIIVQGTDDLARARSIVSRYIGT
jgi:adenylyltransferase/sulfurtransferase